METNTIADLRIFARCALAMEEGDEDQIYAENRVCQAAMEIDPSFEDWCHDATSYERIQKACEILGFG